MADISPFLSTLGIVAGVLGSVSMNNSVAFTFLKHLGISTVQMENSVKWKLLLLYITSSPDF